VVIRRIAKRAMGFCVPDAATICPTPQRSVMCANSVATMKQGTGLLCRERGVHKSQFYLPSLQLQHRLPPRMGTEAGEGQGKSRPLGRALPLLPATSLVGETLQFQQVVAVATVAVVTTATASLRFNRVGQQ